jgi:hypothetical protein
MLEIGPMGLLKFDGPKLAFFKACPELVETSYIYLIEMFLHHQALNLMSKYKCII